MKKIILIATLGLLLGGCQEVKVPSIQSEEYPRFSDTIPMVENFIFKFPTIKHETETSVISSGATTSKIKYTIAYEELRNKSAYNLRTIRNKLNFNADTFNIKAECNNSINLNEKKLISSNCDIKKDGKLSEEINNLNSKEQKMLDSTFNAMVAMLINPSLVNKLKSNNVNIKSGSILYKDVAEGFDQLMLSFINLNPNRKQTNEQLLQFMNKLKKDMEYEVIVKGWGLYKNKRVIVTQFQQELDMKDLFYNIWITRNKTKDKKAFNKMIGNKQMTSKSVGYELYDPNTFIKVYSHNFTYTNMLNKITKSIKITKLK